MDEGEAARYWCHMCSRMVNPIIEVEIIECPLCQSGFLEEMETAPASNGARDVEVSDADRVLSLLAPIWLGMVGNTRGGRGRGRGRVRRYRRLSLEESSDDDDEDDDDSNGRHDEEAELDHAQRRRRNSATILQRLQDIRAGMLLESANSESRDSDGRDRERVILINPLNQTIIVQGSYDLSDNLQNQHIGSLGDYFMGPGLDMLLQHLSENDPNRYGSPPAQKEAVEAMPTVKIESCLQCSVCLDDFEIGAEAKEMPCNHKFHSECILPWLELHSSCPVCRYQLPSNESKLNSDTLGNYNTNSTTVESVGGSSETNHSGGEGGDVDGRTNNTRRFSAHMRWPFSSLFSSSASSSSMSGSSTNAFSSSSDTEEH